MNKGSSLAPFRSTLLFLAKKITTTIIIKDRIEIKPTPRSCPTAGKRGITFWDKIQEEPAIDLDSPLRVISNQNHLVPGKGTFKLSNILDS